MQLETFYIKLQIPTGLSTFQEASHKLSTLVTRGEYDIILRKWTWSKTSVDNRPFWRMEQEIKSFWVTSRIIKVDIIMNLRLTFLWKSSCGIAWNTYGKSHVPPDLEIIKKLLKHYRRLKSSFNQLNSCLGKNTFYKIKKMVLQNDLLINSIHA